MEEHAYAQMQQMQARHWWWRGMRRLYRTALHKYLSPPTAIRLTKSRRLADIGCGFGANLEVLNEHGAVVGVDVSLEALQAIRQRPSLGLVQAAADALPFKDGAFDAVALLAVVEHAEDDVAVLRESRRVTRAGGLQILLTSAFMLLWSHHDIANEHKRRYRTVALDQAQQAAGWRVLRSTYVNVALFPAVALVRWWQRRQEPAEQIPSEYDMGPNLGPFGAIPEAFLALEAAIVVHTGLPLPFGVDLFSIARNEES
jgi:ubiquinone/menaquinone biosynthesis C-methylase UbiE